jgi:hypothetical protein
MKVASFILCAIAALVALTAGTSPAEAEQRSGCRHGSNCYQGRAYVRPYPQEGWLSFRFFGDFSGPCGPLLRKAIEIDTPDPRYWNAYDRCIGL